MALRLLKDYWRRRQLARRGVVPQPGGRTFTAGARSGVWTVCPEGLGPGSVVYSFGVGDNIAWDLAMIDRFGVEVHAFDPTPPCVDWVRDQRLPPKFHFHPVGLAAHDGSLEFFPPRKRRGFNYTPGRPGAGAVEAGLTVPVCRLRTICERLRHRRVDVLKMDIEGGEYDALDDLLASGVPAGQLLVEFHHHFPGVGVGRTVRTVRALSAAGFRLFHVSARGLELSFRRDG